MVGGGAMCAQDVPPFTIAQGDRARLYGINIMGLKKAGLQAATVSNLKNAWRTLFASDLPRRDAMRRVRERYEDTPEVLELLTFMTTTRRGLCRAGTR